MEEFVWTPMEEIQKDDIIELFEDRLRVTETFHNQSDIRVHFEPVSEVPSGNPIVSLTAYRGAKLQVVK